MDDVHCVLEAADHLGETPLWCGATQTLWWIDIERPKLHSLNPITGAHQTVAVDCEYLGSLALRKDGRLLLARDLALETFDPATQHFESVCQVEAAGSGNRLNDGRCDAKGRFWVGSMDNGLCRPSGSFYRIEPDGSVHRQFGGIIVTNSVVLSPDGRTLYMSDTRRFILWAFDIDPDEGVLSNRRIFVDHTATGDRPDGACVDAEGFLWNAIFAGGRVVRYAPDGRIDRVVPVPVTNPTCVCFGGPDLRTLYITTARKFLSEAQLAAEPLAGALLAFEPGVRGLPEALFGT